DLVRSLLQPRFSKAHGLGQQRHDFPVALALGQWGDGRPIISQQRMTVRLVQVRLLELRSGGQNEISVLRCVRQEQLVDDREEIFALEAGNNAAGVGTGGCWVGSEDEQGWD